MYSTDLSHSNIKQHIRNLIKSRVSNMDVKYGRVLTLPCLDFTLEVELSKTHNVHTVEKYEHYYTQQVKMCKGSGIKNIHSDLTTFLLKTNNYYDYAYLDLCGQVSKDMIIALVSIKCNNLAITVLMRRERKRWSKYSKSKDDMYNKLFNSLGYRIETSIKYNNKGIPMCTYFLTK